MASYKYCFVWISLWPFTLRPRIVYFQFSSLFETLKFLRIVYFCVVDSHHVRNHDSVHVRVGNPKIPSIIVWCSEIERKKKWKYPSTRVAIGHALTVTMDLLRIYMEIGFTLSVELLSVSVKLREINWRKTIYYSLIRVTFNVDLVVHGFKLSIYFEYNLWSDRLLAFGFSFPLLLVAKFFSIR